MRTGMPLIAILLLLVSTAASARVLPYEQAKSLLMQNNAMLKAYRNEAEAASSRYSQALGAYLPKVTVSETWSNTDEPGNAAFATMKQSEFDNQYFANELADPDPVTNWTTKVEVRQPLFMNGKILYGVKQAKQGREAAGLTVERVRQSLLHKLDQAYFAVGLTDQALAVVRASYARTNEYYALTKDYYDNGMLVRSDVLVAETHLLMNEQAIKDAEKRFAVAQSNLQRLIDATDENLEVSCNFSLYSVDRTLDQYITHALANRQDLKAMERKAEIMRYELSKTRGQFLPELALFADYEENGGSFGESDGSGVTVGARLSLNVFNGTSDYHAQRAARFDWLATQNRVADMRMQVRSDVKTAYFETIAAEKNLAAAEKRVESARQALQIIRGRFDEGLAKITDLLDREIDLREAELSLCQSEYTYTISKSALLLATGMLDTPK